MVVKMCEFWKRRRSGRTLAGEPIWRLAQPRVNVTIAGPTIALWSKSRPKPYGEQKANMILSRYGDPILPRHDCRHGRRRPYCRGHGCDALRGRSTRPQGAPGERMGGRDRTSDGYGHRRGEERARGASRADRRIHKMARTQLNHSG